MDEPNFAGMKLHTADSQFSVSTDSMVLADFAAFSPKSSVCDLGCGCGTLSLLLLGKYSACRVTGIEIQADAVKAAQQNCIQNQLEDRFTVLQGDLREYRTLFPPGSFEAVVSNPPYYPLPSGHITQSESLSIARFERCCTLQDLCACAAYLLRYGGSFSFVHKPERLADLMCTLRAENLEPKRLRLVRHHLAAPVSLVLIEAKKAGKPSLNIDPDLILFDLDGKPTEAYRRIYHL